MLEIGSFCGLSASVIAFFAEAHGRPNRLFTCDPWSFEAPDEGRGAPVSDSSYREFVKESFRRTAETFSAHSLPAAIDASSDDFFRQWDEGATADDVFGRELQLGGSLSFCFIDGDHTYECARRDFENCDRHLDIGGLILFDDSADGAPFGVTRVIAELKNDSRYEILDKNPNYLVRKIRE